MKMLDGIAGNSGSGSPKPCLAVNSDGTWLTFSYFQKLANDIERWRSTVSEGKFIMANTSLLEFITIVCLIVQSDDSRDSHFFEDRDIVFGSEGCALNRLKITPDSSFDLS